MKAIITDYEFPHLDQEKAVFAAAGIHLEAHQCHTEEALIETCRGAQALISQYSPLTRRVIEQLDACKIIVRYGIGYDNIDVQAATDHSIAVSNIPDYATGEVADHGLALALSLSRQLPLIDERLRSGTWDIIPDFPMPSYRDMRFVTLGFGRIAREVLERARAFGFSLAAYDPFVPDEVFAQAGVEKIEIETAIATADILSLHMPLLEATRNTINAEALKRMKKTAILINTSRGPLIDTRALAQALQDGEIFAAGLDVFENEPLERDHPILAAPRTVLTSHVAWHSSASIENLQRMAAEEAVRGLREEPLRSQINKSRQTVNR